MANLQATSITGNLTVTGIISGSSYQGSVIPGDGNYAIQFNSGSTFSGSTNLIYNYTTNILSGTTAQFTTISGSTAVFQNDIFVTGSTRIGRGPGTGAASNIVFGSSALNANTTGFSNVAIGPSALSINTTGDRNVAIGDRALQTNVSGDDNTAIGSNAAQTTTGNRNTAIGSLALQFNTTGNDNVGIGNRILQQNTTGIGNTAVGRNALAANTTGSNNTAIGNAAGESLNTGSFNLFLGATAGQTETSLSNTVIIAANTERLRIDSNGNVGIAKTTPNARLDVSGSTIISGSLTVTGSTTLTTVSGTTAQFTTISASVVSASSYVGLPSSPGSTPGDGNFAIQFNSGSTFSGSTNFIYNYTTNTLSGTTAQFTTISGSVVSASSYLGLPFSNSTFTPVRSSNLGSLGSNTRVMDTTYQNTTGRAIFVNIVATQTSSSPGYIAFYIDSNQTSVNNKSSTVLISNDSTPNVSGFAQTSVFYVPANHYYRAFGGSTVPIWYEYEIFGGGGDVILSASNTFTGINTFNSNFVTASAGITGSVAQFTSITGSTFFSASNPSHWSVSAPTNLQDAINRVAAAIFNGLTGSIA